MTNKVTNITTLCRKCIIKVSVGALCKWQVQYKCWSQILARRFWPQTLARKNVARKCWPANIDPQILARKYWPANFGPQILTRKFWPAKMWPANLGLQKCGPQILARKNVARKCWPANVGPQILTSKFWSAARSPHSSHSQTNNLIFYSLNIPVLDNTGIFSLYQYHPILGCYKVENMAVISDS